MCTSEARSRTAWVKMLSTTWTTGAFSATTVAVGARRRDACGCPRPLRRPGRACPRCRWPGSCGRWPTGCRSWEPATVGPSAHWCRPTGTGDRHSAGPPPRGARRRRAGAGWRGSRAPVRGHERQRRRFGRVAPEVGYWHPEEVRQGFGQPPLVQRADVDEDLAEPLAGAGLGLEGGGDLRLGHHATGHEHVAQASLGRRRVHRRCSEGRPSLVEASVSEKGPNSGPSSRSSVRVSPLGSAGLSLRRIFMVVAPRSRQRLVSPVPPALLVFPLSAGSRALERPLGGRD